MKTSEKIIHFLNQKLNFLKFCACRNPITNKYFLLKRGRTKPYEGDFSLGCVVGIGKNAHSELNRFAVDGGDWSPTTDNPSTEFPWFYSSNHFLGDINQIKHYGNKSELEKAIESIHGHKKDFFLDTSDEDVMKNVFFFTSVRNPYSRAHGAWQECKENYMVNMNFKEFLLYVREVSDAGFNTEILEGKNGLTLGRAWWHFRPQLLQMLDCENKIGVHFICRVENLGDELNECLKNFHNFKGGAPCLHTNIKYNGNSHKRMGSGYREFYDNESRRLVEEIYWTDIDYFNYEF